MDDIENRDPVTVALSIIAVAAFVATLTYTSAALAKEDKRRGNYWHRVCASQTSTHVLRCRAFLQGLHDGLIVGSRRRNRCLVERQVRWLKATLRRSGHVDFSEITPRTNPEKWQPAPPTARDVPRRQIWQLAASRR
jgi:hypothetical protein